MNRNAYYYEKTTYFLGCEVDIYGVFRYTFSLERRVIGKVKRSPLGPYARGLWRYTRRLLHLI